MKTGTYLLLIFAVIFSIQSCGNSASDSGQNTTLAQDSLLDTVSATDHMLEDKETEFIQNAALGGMLEVEASGLVMQKSTNAEVRKFSQMIITDHKKVNAELAGIAGNKGLKLPATLKEEQSLQLDKMRTYTGDGFDRYYMELMVAEHSKAIDLFSKATDFEDKDLSYFGEKILPVLKAHYKSALAIHTPMIEKLKGQGDDLLNESGKVKNQR